MQSRYRRLQSLMTPLRVLEAAARLGNFTKAAEELGMSQPNVSRHIANLEQDLGTALFVRDHNKIALTDEGRLLANSTDLGLSHIQSAVENATALPQKEGLTLACTHSFAHGWLLPRFSSLRRAIQDIPIKLVVSYWLKDVTFEEVDLMVTWSTDGSTDWPRQHLFDEIIYPVCAPAYLERNQDILILGSLAHATLLDYDILDDDQVDWNGWFAEQGVALGSLKGSDKFSNYHFMIQAAMDGEGVALGWHHLVADQIDQGRLVKIGPSFSRPSSSYALEYRQNRVSQAAVARVLDWFQQQANRAKQPN